MEVDLDPSANGLRVANEVAGGADLLSTEAFVDLAANPTGTVPNTGAINLGSVGSSLQGGANGINGTVASSSVLDTSSLTAEFWARTGETRRRSSSAAAARTASRSRTRKPLDHLPRLERAGGGVAVTLNTGTT